MRQICPNCQQSVTIADSEAGKTTPCPACQQPFAIPAHFSATVFEPPPSPLPAPAPVSEPTASIAISAPPAASPPTATQQPSTERETHAPQLPAVPEGYAKLCSVALSRTVCQWLVPVCLTLALFLTFFNWVGLYPAGYAAYTQNGWQALVADLSVDPVSEKELKMEGPLNDWLRPSWWLLPYMVLLIVGVLLACGEPLAKRFHWKLPPIVENLGRFRPALLIACAGITLFFLLIQTAAGFGVERALNYKIQDHFKDARKEAKTPEEIQKVEMQVAGVRGSYHLRATNWLRTTIALHIVALLAVIGDTLLVHRNDRPPPRIGVMW